MGNNGINEDIVSKEEILSRIKDEKNVPAIDMEALEQFNLDESHIINDKVKL